jgi:hypothetical protein
MMAIVASFPLVALGIEPVTLALALVSFFQGVDYAMDGAAGW